VMPQLDGSYFFADYCTNRIWSFRYDGAEISDSIERTTELAPGHGQSIGSISSFGEDGYGELFVADLNDGEIFKIVPRNPGVVRGRVTNQSGQAIPAVAVSIRRTGIRDTTDGAGNYYLDGLGEGAFNIEFTHPGYRDTTLGGVNVGEGDTTAVDVILLNPVEINEDDRLPFFFELYQNYPNPFNNLTQIEYELGQACNVKIDIYNIRGGKITTLVERLEQGGRHQVKWEAIDCPSGVYFYKIKAGGFSAARRLLLLK